MRHALWVMLITSLWGTGLWGVLYGAYWTVSSHRADRELRELQRELDIRHELHQVHAYVMENGRPRYYPIGIMP